MYSPTRELIKDLKKRMKNKENFTLKFIGENKMGMSEATIRIGEIFGEQYKKEAKTKWHSPK